MQRGLFSFAKWCHTGIALSRISCYSPLTTSMPMLFLCGSILLILQGPGQCPGRVLPILQGLCPPKSEKSVLFCLYSGVLQPIHGTVLLILQGCVPSCVLHCRPPLSPFSYHLHCSTHLLQQQDLFAADHLKYQLQTMHCNVLSFHIAKCLPRHTSVSAAHTFLYSSPQRTFYLHDKDPDYL